MQPFGLRGALAGILAWPAASVGLVTAEGVGGAKVTHPASAVANPTTAINRVTSSSRQEEPPAFGRGSVGYPTVISRSWPELTTARPLEGCRRAFVPKSHTCR